MHPCQKNGKGKKKNRRPQSLVGPPVVVKPVDECAWLGEIFEHCLPAFGAAYLRRIYLILRRAIMENVPLVLAIAGPITVSNQHRAWLIPLLKTGWVAYITTTDAVCYHDGHDSLHKFKKRPIHSVELFGDDAEYRKHGIIRVTDTGFSEKILLEQDRMISAVLERPEFQKKMTTTERNHRLGYYYAAQEKKFGVPPGLLSTCTNLGIPVHIGAPADGSIFLNSLKLWTLKKLGSKRLKDYAFDYDLHADVFESCSYHYWGIFHSEAKSLGAAVLGGGTSKNYSLQPEPMLSQLFFLSDIRGYDYDVQIVSSPVTDGSLSSCFPAEAVSWGKVNPETYRYATESLQCDYSIVMPFLVKALLDDPALPRRPQLRLYAKREETVENLFEAIAQNGGRLEKTLNFPLQLVARASGA